MIRIKKGLDLPLSGQPDQSVTDRKTCSKVAVLGGDYPGLRPTMAVRVADTVRLGQLLFTDKKAPEIRYTAPGAGRILAIHRGERRSLLSVVIQLSGGDEVIFKSHSTKRLSQLKRAEVVESLLESGLWTSFRTRPFSRVPSPGTSPHSIFVTAMDTNPLAPAVEQTLAGHEADLVRGLQCISRLTDGTVFLCKSPEVQIPEADLPNLVTQEFSGPHPAGSVGTHIHFLDPVHRNKTVWHIGLQDVIACGKLLATGRLWTERTVSLAGPQVRRPRLIRTRVGACLEETVAGELLEGAHRVISGSVLSGHTAEGPRAFLGRYHQQISVLPENPRRVFLGWLDLGWNSYSVKNVVLSKLAPGKRFALDTGSNGEQRAIIPNGNYERVMPLDILPLFLLRALAVDDLEEAESLGALELDEEDLSLCAFVCPSKLEFGPMLRRNLMALEREE